MWPIPTGSDSSGRGETRPIPHRVVTATGRDDPEADQPRPRCPQAPTRGCGRHDGREWLGGPGQDGPQHRPGLAVTPPAPMALSGGLSLLLRLVMAWDPSGPGPHIP